MAELTAEPRAGTAELGIAPDDLARHLDQYRRELTAYCYRMLGSSSESEDAVQEVMVRAWRSYGRFEGRSTLRSWLYRIATNVCLTMLGASQRRARPMDMGPAGSAIATLPAPLPETTWIEPVPDGRVIDLTADPAEQAVERETVRLAFVAALQHLPSKQRAVLILREVLHWRAAEVAELLDTTVASVNSALQRARATRGDGVPDTDVLDPSDEAQQALVAAYADAFERYDMEALVALLHQDATLSMPPYDTWLRGSDEVVAWMLGHGHGCRGSRLVPVQANGSPAFGQYRPAAGGGHEPWALQVLEVVDGRIVALNSFLDTATLFPLFGLPDRL